LNRQTNSLSNKLIKANRWIVGLAMLVFGLIVYLGLWSLTKSFSEFNSVNTQKTKETIRKQAEENIQHIRKNFTQTKTISICADGARRRLSRELRRSTGAP
jgi:hypothetical protein